MADTPDENLAALIAEERSFDNSVLRSSDRQDGDSLPEIAEEPFKQAIVGAHSQAFRKFVADIEPIDISTEAGKRDALDLGWSCESHIVQRLLCFGEQKLARRHWALAKLNDCRTENKGHFTFALAVNPATGQVPARVQRSFSIVGPAEEHVLLLNSILRGKFVGRDWYNYATGVYALKSLASGGKYTAVHELDFWCRPQCVLDLCDYLHKLMVARGWPDAVSSGWTFKSWGDRYVKYLHRCLDLRTLDEQYAWLERGGDQMVAFLRAAEVTVYSSTVQSVPTEDPWGALAAVDCQPAKNLDAAEATLDSFVENADMFAWIGVGNSAQEIDPEKLPRLSDKAKPKPPGKVGLTKEEKKAKAAAEAAKRAAQRESYADDDTAGVGIPPGSTKHTAFWLAPKKGTKPLLYVSGKVWDVAALCAKYGVHVDAKCFEVILCARSAKNKMGNCPAHTSNGHKTASDAAHVLPGFDYDADAASLARDPTADERAKYNAAVAAAVANGAKPAHGGRAKGAPSPDAGRGRGRGRGRGGAPHFGQPAAQ